MINSRTQPAWSKLRALWWYFPLLHISFAPAAHISGYVDAVCKGRYSAGTLHTLCDTQGQA